jgi:hypothetical protein
MGLYAKIKEGVVEQVILADADFIQTLPDKEFWIEAFDTAENNPKGMMPSVGDTYDSETVKFYPAKPYPSWVWNEEKWAWNAPVPYPEDDMECTDNECRCHEWDEASVSWVPITRQLP